MIDRPIDIPASRIPALLDGRMTQYRAPLKPQPQTNDFRGILLDDHVALFAKLGTASTLIRNCEQVPLPHAIGDRRWLRETWQQFFDDELPAERKRQVRSRMGIPARPDLKSWVAYRADGEIPDHPEHGKALWRSSRHMPRWASRITLTVTDLAVHRVQDISEADAIAEGLYSFQHDDPVVGSLWGFHTVGMVNPPDRKLITTRPAGWDNPRHAFAALFDAFYGPDAWDRNDWVLALTFRVDLCNIDQMEEADG